MSSITLADVLRRIHNLPSLPAVVIELLASLEGDDVHIEKLASEISQDQALSAKTLRLANSSFYGMARQVTTIQEAVAILGLGTVRNVVTTASLMGAFPSHPPGGFDATPFWRHAIAVAVCARALALGLQSNPDLAYTAGLIHDIGRLVLVTQFQSDYEATLAFRMQHDCGLLEAERAVLGLDHAAVGQALSQQWKFPPAIQEAVAAHHRPDCRGLLLVTKIVMAANAIAHALDLSAEKEDAVPALPLGLWADLGLEETSLLSAMEETRKRFEDARLALAI